MKPYDAKNWYWIVAGDATQVYSSASRAYVPINNSTYAAWLAAGGVPSRIASFAELREIVVPRSVTMAQARLALANAGLLAQIEAGFEALSEPQKTTVLTAWEYSPTVSRNGSLVTSLAGPFGLTEQDLDDLFIAASEIEL